MPTELDPSPVSSATSVPTVLLVEDDGGLRELLEEVLAQMGTRVLATADGREALEALESMDPDLIVTDLRMPGVDGVALVRSLVDRGIQAPVIVVTAYPSAEAHALLAEGAIAAILRKPFLPGTLSQMVHRMGVFSA